MTPSGRQDIKGLPISLRKHYWPAAGLACRTLASHHENMNATLRLISEDVPAIRPSVNRLMQGLDYILLNWGSAGAAEEAVLSGKADLWVVDAEHICHRLPQGLEIAALISSAESSPKMIALVCHADRADLRGLMHSIDVRNAYGKVWLVGAGPGSPDLITVRAQRILEGADIVFYDDLVDESLPALCLGERIYVGKRKGRAPFSQDAINEMVYRSACSGKFVVRLKGGDPSIFGRGGEELDYLRHRWMPVEVIPGVTAASAASASALFSLTQRGIARSLTLLSAHGIDRGVPRSSENATIVYYMAASKMCEISNDLLRHGIDSNTPVAIICHAGTWKESCISCTVGSMQGVDAPSPALVIVGEATRFARIERKALYTGLSMDGIHVHQCIVRQPLIATESVHDRTGHPPGISLKPLEPTPKPLNLSFFSSVIFSSTLEVSVFREIYGNIPDHLLCHVLDDSIADALKTQGIHPWRIVPCRVKKRLSKDDTARRSEG